MRQKKNRKQRGATTHGWGSKKKHRGAGHRGGRGNAGSGKRGDAKKPSYWKNMSYYGKRGFTSKHPVREAAINVGHLASAVTRLAAEGSIQAKGSEFTIDLGRLGIERLLGTGMVQQKLFVTVAQASKRAVEKVEQAGGKVTVTQTND